MMARVLPDDLEREIEHEQYLRPGIDPDTGLPHPDYHAWTLTICVLTLRNGISLVGQSACVDPAEFNDRVGRQIARKDAINKMWPLLGMRLADKLHASPDKLD